jgi:carbon-monoxide dehydrogenase medium subunit
MIEIESEQSVAYAAPETVDEVLALLAERDEAKVVAGGQSLFVFLRQGLLQPSLLIGLKQIPELHGIDATPDVGIRIGAMVTQHALERSPLVTAAYPALAGAVSAVASPPVRRQGTIGGNLCHADPTGDPPAALIALGAEVEIASIGNRRRIQVEALFVDYMETVVRPDELLVAVHVPAPGKRAGSAYLKHRIRGVDTALVGAGVSIRLSGDWATIEAARIGLAGAGTTPIRAVEAEAALAGAPATTEWLERAARAAATECAPLADTEGSEWYRREMVAVFVRRAAERALARARLEG